MWSQSCSRDVRHGGQHRRCNRRSRHSSTPVWGTSTKFNGKRRSEMKICGSEQDMNQWPSRYCGGSGAGSDTPSGSQHPAPHTKPWPGTRRGREREASLATVGGETLKQSWNSKGPTGLEWPEQPRTECDGEGSLMACATPGAMAISKLVCLPLPPPLPSNPPPPSLHPLSPYLPFIHHQLNLNCLLPQ